MLPELLLSDPVYMFPPLGLKTSTSLTKLLPKTRMKLEPLWLCSAAMELYPNVDPNAATPWETPLLLKKMVELVIMMREPLPASIPVEVFEIRVLLMFTTAVPLLVLAAIPLKPQSEIVESSTVSSADAVAV